MQCEGIQKTYLIPVAAYSWNSSIPWVGKRLGQLLVLYFTDRSGATALEYGLLAGAIALAIIASIGVLGDEVVALYNTIEITISSP